MYLSCFLIDLIALHHTALFEYGTTDCAQTKCKFRTQIYHKTCKFCGTRGGNLKIFNKKREGKFTFPFLFFEIDVCYLFQLAMIVSTSVISALQASTRNWIL